MGTIITKSMEENLRRNQDFITEMNKITVERQIQMQNQMRERLTALQIARARELLYWFGSFYALAALGMIAGCVDYIGAPRRIRKCFKADS